MCWSSSAGSFLTSTFPSSRRWGFAGSFFPARPCRRSSSSSTQTRALKIVRRSADNSTVPHTLLLADDSVTIQRVIELTFADEDIVVVAVSEGDEAIAALTETPPDIVLADIGMPGRTGYEVAQHIKETPRLSHIPVLLLTGASEPVDQSRAAEVGCDGVLSKPFEPQLVVGRVKELLAKPKRAPSEHATTLTFPQP